MKLNINYYMLVAEIVIFVVIDAVFYVLADKPLTDSATYSFVFMNVGFVLAFFLPMFAPKSESRSMFTGAVGFTVFGCTVVEIVLAAVFIYFWDSVLYGGILQVIVLVVCLVLAMLEIGAGRSISPSVARDADYRDDFLKVARGNMKNALLKASPGIRPVVEKAHDEVMSMPMKAKAATEGLDAEIKVMTGEVLEAVMSGDDSAVEEACGRLSAKVLERNAVFQSNQTFGKNRIRKPIFKSLLPYWGGD